MKTLTLALTTVLAFQLHSALAATPEEETRFVTAAKQAFEKHDADALMALTCWDRVPDRFKDKRAFASDVALSFTDISLVAPDRQFADFVWKDSDGITYRLNLPVVKQLKISFVKGSRVYPVGEKDGTIMRWHPANDIQIYPVGEKDGKFYVAEPEPVK
jgi:hypothetical protein